MKMTLHTTTTTPPTPPETLLSALRAIQSNINQCHDYLRQLSKQFLDKAIYGKQFMEKAIHGQSILRTKQFMDKAIYGQSDLWKK